MSRRAVRTVAAGVALLAVTSAAARGSAAPALVTVRLTTPLSTDGSAAGDAVAAVVLGLPGADAAVPPGCLMQGRVVEAVNRAHEHGGRAVLRVTFDSVRDRAGTAHPLPATVTAVDNARETVDDSGAIVGLPPVHTRPTGLQALLMLAAHAHPMALAASEALRLGVKLVERPDIAYPAGVRLTLALGGAAPMLNCDMPSAVERPLDDGATTWVRGLPRRAQAGTPPRDADWINVVVLGTAADTAAAFAAAGWTTATRTSVRADARTFLAVVERSGYQTGPVSLLSLDGAAPAMVFQRQTDTFAKRHHVRLWPVAGVANAWLAAATHDIGLEFSHRTRHYTHRIDGAIDDERSTVLVDLVDARAVRHFAFVDRPEVPRTSVNATGDAVTTDGRVLVVTLAGAAGTVPPR